MSKKSFTSKPRAPAKRVAAVAPKKRAPAKRAKVATSKRRKQPDELLKLVGAQIREVRRERGLSGDHLAHAIPLDRAHLGLIETGKIAPNIKTLVKIAAALECEVGDLIPYVEDLLPHADWLEE
ncbi:helix-turn-helix domain-containing protein [Lysobacter sp. Hz 25]|uniref:helix-turn-helix domain-containing protein n=1 Tax=Lysobacter sp. Hz 25 TaxID=3383698 RepID=UPI0038D4D5FC